MPLSCVVMVKYLEELEVAIHIGEVCAVRHYVDHLGRFYMKAWLNQRERFWRSSSVMEYQVSRVLVHSLVSALPVPLRLVAKYQRLCTQ